MSRGLTRVLTTGAVLVVVVLPGTAYGQQGTVARLTGRLHYQWNSTSVSEEEAGTVAPIASNTFETRRARMAVDVTVSDWIRGLLEADFALGRLALRQAWLAFELDSGLVLRAGQVKKPFNAMFLTSSSRFPVIERGVRIRGLGAALSEAGAVDELRGEPLIGEHFTLVEGQRYSMYEMGVQLEASRGPVGVVLGAYNGTGPDLRDENDSKSFAGRMTWRVPASGPLAVSAAWSHRELNWPTAVSTTTESGNAFAVDVELGGFRRGWWLIAEAATGDNLVTLERFSAAQAVLARFIGTGGRRIEGVEPVGRVSWGDPDRSVAGDAGVLLTPGINLYFLGSNRLMLNWDVYLPEADAVGTQHAARAQVNLQF